MRFSLALALVSMLVSAPVFAAEDDNGGKDKKGKEKKKKGEEKTGPSMDSGEDPVSSEKSDDGPFKPKSDKPVINKETGKAEPPPKARPRDPIVVYLEPLIGFGQGFSPSNSASAQEGMPDSTVITIEAGGTYDFSPKMSLGLRLAWSTASIDPKDGGESFSSTAFAAPELMFEYRHALSALTSLPILVGLGIPVAQGTLDPSEIYTVKQRQGMVNSLADASHGFRDGELYQPKRLPLILGAGLRHGRGALDLHAATKFVFGFNIGGAVKDENFFTPNIGTIKANAVAIRNVTLAGIMYEFLEKPALAAGLDAWFSYRAIDPVEFESAADATPPSSFQFVVEPKLGARFGKLSAGAGFLLPVGGPLGDSGMKGVRLNASYAL
jgi:hypothetical protein